MLERYFTTSTCSSPPFFLFFLKLFYLVLLELPVQAVRDEQGADHLAGVQDPAGRRVLQGPAQRAHRREGVLGGQEEHHALAPPRQGGARGQDCLRGQAVAATQGQLTGRFSTVR